MKTKLKTIYSIKIFGRPLHVIGEFHDFKIDVMMDGFTHSTEEIRLKCYEQADHIMGPIRIVNTQHIGLKQ